MIQDLDHAQQIIALGERRALSAAEVIELGRILDHQRALERAAMEIRRARCHGNMVDFWAAVGRVEGLCAQTEDEAWM
jgi:hypothetical protein